MSVEAVITSENKVENTVIDTDICYYYGKDCSSRCDGYDNCWDFESVSEVIYKRKIDKTYKLL